MVCNWIFEEKCVRLHSAAGKLVICPGVCYACIQTMVDASYATPFLFKDLVASAAICPLELEKLCPGK